MNKVNVIITHKCNLMCKHCYICLLYTSDIIEVLTGSARPRKYWSDLKKQLTLEGSEV